MSGGAGVGQQDLPPSEGFTPITFKRHLPKRGPPGWLLLSGALSLTFGSMYIYMQGQEIYREKLQARYSLEPLLKAEEALLYLRDKQASMKAEAELMKNVPGWEVGKSPYQGDRYHYQKHFIK